MNTSPKLILSVLLLVGVLPCRVSAQTARIDFSERPVEIIDLSQYIVKTWTVEDGLPVNQIFQVLHASDEFIWIATGGGLVRFDGISFEVFTRENSEGLDTSYFMTVAEDANGAIWSRLRDNVVRFDSGVFTAFPDVLNAELKYADAIHAEPDGSFWMIDENVLSLHRSDRREIYSVHDKPPPFSVLSALEKQTSQPIYLISEEGRLLRIQAGQLTELTELEQGVDATVIQIVPDKTGGLWNLPKNPTSLKSH